MNCVKWKTAGNFISQWNRGWVEVWPGHPSNKDISQAEPQWDFKKRKKFPPDRRWKRSESLTHISPLRPWSKLMEKDRPFQVERERLLSRTFGQNASSVQQAWTHSSGVTSVAMYANLTGEVTLLSCSAETDGWGVWVWKAFNLFFFWGGGEWINC